MQACSKKIFSQLLFNYVEKAPETGLFLLETNLSVEQF